MAQFADMVDPQLLEGVWWDYETKQPCPGNVPDKEHGCFLVAPNLGSRFESVLSEEQTPYAQLFRRKPSEAEKEEHEQIKEREFVKIRARAMARTIFLDGANWQDPDGKPKEWTLDARSEFLSDRRFIVYAEFIAACARSTEAVLAREEEEARGN